MTLTRNCIILSLAAAFLCSCATLRKESGKSTELDRFITLMNGSFDSSMQAKSDSAYFDISLHMSTIWKEKDGHWLYVEQAVSKSLAKPYRQRVYKLERTDKKTFKSSVYTLKTPEQWIGKWKTPDDLRYFTETDIELKNGCEVILELQEDGTFSGGTLGSGCESNLRGASYATSKVMVNDTLLVSWDQGFDKTGKQVWGATKGPYRFVRN